MKKPRRSHTMTMYLSGTMDGPLCEECGHLLPPDGKCLLSQGSGHSVFLPEVPDAALIVKDWLDALSVREAE